MHMDGQTAAMFAIVAGAFYIVGRRLWGQIAAFRGRPTRHASERGAKKAAVRPPQLIQLQTRPPLHLKRPPADDK